MRFLSHPEHLAHLRRCWRCTVDAIILVQRSVGLAQLLEVRMLESLARTQSVIVIVDQQLAYQVDGIGELWYQLREASALHIFEIKFHMASHFLKLIEQLFLWRS